MVEVFAPKVASALFSLSFSTVKSTVKELRKRIADLKLTQKLQDDLCRRVDHLQGIIQQIETTAHDTDDESILRGIEEIRNDFTKCLKACDEIETRNPLSKLWNASSDKKLVNEIDSLLIHSLEVLSFLLEVSNYHDNADRRKDLKHIEAVVRNPRAGCYELSSDEKLEKVENLSVEECSPGVLQVSWQRVQAEFLYYELEYDQQNGAYFQINKSLKRCLLDSTKIVFPSKLSYEIRMRAVNGAGPGEWSEWAVGKFTVLPSPPRKPLAIHVYSSTSVTLVVERVPEELCVKPVTHYVVDYREIGDNKYTNRTFAIRELEVLTLHGKDAYKLKLDWNIDAAFTPIYNVKISLRNADGDSLPCQNYIKTSTISPGKPEELMVVHKDTHCIEIKWTVPKTNFPLVSYYEVRWGRNKNTTNVMTTELCYAVFDELESHKKYSFILRSVSRTGCRSEFIEIDATTKSRAVEAAKSALEFADYAATSLEVLPHPLPFVKPKVDKFKPYHKQKYSVKSPDIAIEKQYLGSKPIVNIAGSVEHNGKPKGATCMDAARTGTEDKTDDYKPHAEPLQLDSIESIEESSFSPPSTESDEHEDITEILEDHANPNA